jgi:hypothetical protein
MSDIGNYSFVITASADQAVTAIDQVAKKVDAMHVAGSKMAALGATVSQGMSTLQSAISSPTAALEAMTGAATHLAGGIPVLGAVLGPATAGIVSFIHHIDEGVHRLAAMGKGAREVGMDVEQFSGLMTLAGGRADEMASAMTHFARAVGELSFNKDRRFALQGLGLDPDAMKDSASGLDEIVRRYRQLNTEAEKSFLLQEAGFGRQAEVLKPLLEKAAGNPDRLRAILASYGQSPEDVASAQVQAQEEAERLRRWEQARLKNVGWWSKLMNNIGEGFASGIEGIPAQDLRPPKIELPPEAPITAGPPATPEYKEMVKTIEASNDALKLQIEMFGQSADTVERYKAKLAGVTQAQIDLNQAQNDQFRAQQQQQRIWSELGKIIDAAASPIEKMNEELLFLNAQRDKLGDAAYFARVGQLSQSLFGQLGYSQAPANPFAEAGSREANRALYEFQMMGGSNIQERMRALLEQSNQKQQILIQQGQMMVEELRRIETPTIAVF